MKLGHGAKALSGGNVLNSPTIPDTAGEGRAVQESSGGTKDGGASPGGPGYTISARRVVRGLVGSIPAGRYSRPVIQHTNSPALEKKRKTTSSSPRVEWKEEEKVLLVETIKKLLERVKGLEAKVEALERAQTNADESHAGLEAKVAALEKANTTAKNSYAKVASQAPEQPTSKPSRTSKKMVEKTTIRVPATQPTQPAQPAQPTEGWTTVQRKQAPKTLKTQAPATTPAKIQKVKYEQLVVNIEKNHTFEIQPLALRNAINLAIKVNGVAKVEKSTRGNIVLTVIPTVITAERMLAQQADWEATLADYPVIGIQTPITWYKLVAQGVPVREFDDLTALKKDIETFNPITVTGEPRWLSKNLEGKRTSSVVFAVTTEKEATYCLRNSIIVAGQTTRVSRFKQFSPRTQCYRCLGFGHNPATCKGKPACRYCGKNHYTTSHRCTTCGSSTPCEHLTPRCANCKGPHHADSLECEVVRAFQPTTSNSTASNSTANRAPPTTTITATTTGDTSAEGMDVEATTSSTSQW